MDFIFRSYTSNLNSNDIIDNVLILKKHAYSDYQYTF